MKIRDIMTVDPVCCAKDETAEAGAILMKELNVGVIPVVEDDKGYKLVGMLTDRDLCMSIIAQGADPKEVTLEKCMSGKLISCRPDEDVEKAIALMEAYKIRRLPVVDAEQRIQGIVSTADIALYSGLNNGGIEKAIRTISRDTAESEVKLYAWGASYFSREKLAC
jgi:CBS domain-containing protein